MNPKVVLVGPAGAGKSAIVRQALGIAQPTTYTPTIGVEVNPVTVNGSTYNVWDCAGWDGLYAGLRDTYAIQADYLIFVGVNANDANVGHYSRISPNAQVIHLSPGDTLDQVL